MANLRKIKNQFAKIVQLKRHYVRTSSPFSFEKEMANILIHENGMVKMTTGLFRVTGWTKHSRDRDIDRVELLNETTGEWEDIKPMLEWSGGQDRIDRITKNYLETEYYSPAPMEMQLAH